MLSLKERCPRCGAAWTGCCRRVEDVTGEFFTTRAPLNGFHVSFEAVLRFKLLTTYITIKHLQVWQFLSYIFQRRYMLGFHNVGTSNNLKLRKLLTFVSFPLVYLHTSVRFETVSTNVTLECVFSLLWQSDLRLNISFRRHRCRVLLLF